MACPSCRRKLAAILSADVVGYSRLMAANEGATVETLKSYRDIIARLGASRRPRGQRARQGEETLELNLERPL
jgi:class 3 adenylate cyclase